MFSQLTWNQRFRETGGKRIILRYTVETELSEQIRKSFNQVIKVRTKI